MSDVPASLTKRLIYLCDETSFLEKEDKMAVAGLAVPRTNLPEVLARMAALPPTNSEAKWKTVNNRNLENRKQLVECLADVVEARLVHFHIRFADFSAYTHDGPRRRRDTVSKMFYQLLLHRAVRHYGSEFKIMIRPDDGPCTEELKDFVGALSVEGQLRYGAHPECIEGVICADSAREPLLQLLDVGMGALTAFKNGRHLLPGASKAKKTLSEYAVAKMGINDIHRNLDDGRRLSVWNVIPRGRGPKG